MGIGLRGMTRIVVASTAIATIVIAAPVQAASARAASAPVNPHTHLRPGVTPTTSIAKSAQTSSAAHLTYYGGHVISHVHVIQVLYGAGTYTPEVQHTTAPSMATFYGAITNSRYFDWLSEYDTPSGTNQIIGRGSFVGQVQIAPTAGNLPAGSTIDDTQIQAELKTQILNGHLPTPNADTYYAVYFPHGVTITQGGAASGQQFCAYHNTVAADAGIPEFYYGVLPDFNTGGMPFGCGNGTTTDNEESVSSHELIEAVTDPEVGLATTNGPPLGWYDSANGEIGDICNAQQASVVGGDGLTYTVQQQWSNAQNGCVSRGPANDFSIGATQTSIAATPSTPATTSITTAVTSGSAGSVALSVSGLPSGATATLNPTSVTAGSSSTLTINVGSAASGTYALQVAGAEGAALHSVALSLQLTAAAAPSITSANSTTFGAGVAGTFQVTTSGNPTPSLAESGALPAGVTFTDNGDGTGTLSGTPQVGTAGPYPLTLTGTNSAGSTPQSFTLTISPAAQPITFTSTAPTSPVVGQTYAVSATGGGSGNPVTFSIDGATPGCSISGSLVTFDHPGNCQIDAAQQGNAQYSAGSANQSVAATSASTSTSVSVTPSTIVASVSPVAPGAGAPTGLVTFSVDGVNEGSAQVVSGTATLNYAVPPGASRSVAAVYAGDGDFLGSSASTTRRDPSIIATVSSPTPASAYRWYRTSVTITFTCTPSGAPLTAACPAPVVLSSSGAGQSVGRTINATDGGAATATVSGINIDLVAPTVAISGPTNGGVYRGFAPTTKCVATDALSGVASCTLASSTSGQKVTTTATATDKAGNVRRVIIQYLVQRQFLANATFTQGAFQVYQRHTYTLVVLTASRTAPVYLGVAPNGQAPRQRAVAIHYVGRQNGLYKWQLSVYMSPTMGAHPHWNLWVRSDGATRPSALYQRA